MSKNKINLMTALWEVEEDRGEYHIQVVKEEDDWLVTPVCENVNGRELAYTLVRFPQMYMVLKSCLSFVESQRENYVRVELYQCVRACDELIADIKLALEDYE